MKPFINKWALLAGCVFLGACSGKDEPAAPVKQPEQVAAVTQTVSAEKPAEPVAAREITLEDSVPVEKKPAPQKVIQAPAILTNLRAWDSNLQFLKTRFEQTTTYDGVPISKSQGMLFYDKNKNMLRLDTTDTDGKTEQTAITDKKQILILDGQGHEITTLSWEEWQKGQPNQALFDFGNYTALLARHNVVGTGNNQLKLTPKEGEKYTLYLTLSQEDYFPQKIKIVSDLMETEAVLTDIQKNKPLAFDTFRQGGLFK